MSLQHAFNHRCTRCAPEPPNSSRSLLKRNHHRNSKSYLTSTVPTINPRVLHLPTPAVAETACTAAVAGGALGLPLPSLLPASGPWGVWAGLIAAGAFGLWSERTRLGKELSGALVATLAGMALANLGYLPPHPKEADIVFKYILPLAIPLLLFSANIARILRETGTLLVAFLLGTATTVVSSWVAMAIFPLRTLGEEGWKIAAALTARHIGGAVNYMAVSETLQISPSTFGAGLAADDLILTLYFITIYSLAKNIPPDAQSQQQQQTSSKLRSSSTTSSSSNSLSSAPQSHSEPGSSSSSSSAAASEGGHTGIGGRTILVYPAMMGVALSALICYLATQLAAAWSLPSQSITIITAITLFLASVLPKQLTPLAASSEGLALMMMQVFFAAVGASADIRLVLRTAPVLFCYSFIALAGHLLLLLGIGKLANISRKDLLLASNANIGGPSTVAGMAATKGWTSMLVPAILTSTLGYALGTFIGIGLGHCALKPLCS